MRNAICRNWVLGLGSGMLACCLVFPVKALTLADAYQSALLNDPIFKSAAFAAQAAAEESNLGLSNLLPEVALNARKMDNRARRDIYGGTQVASDQPVYQSLGGGLYLRQPLFNPEKFAAYKQGGLRAAVAENQLLKDRQDAILRVASVFLDAIIAGEGVNLAVAQKQAAAARDEQASSFFSKGEGTSAEAGEAKSRLGLALIQEGEARDRQLFCISQLSQLTAREVDVLPELVLDPERVDAGNEQLMTLEQWLESSVANNPDIIQKRQALELAENDMRRYSLSGNLPTVDLLANITRNNRDSVTTLNQDIENRAVGIEVNWPLYKGGYFSALIRQSRAKTEQARQDVEVAKLRVRLDVERQFRSVVTGRLKLDALSQLIKAAEKTVESAESSFKAGVRTSVDILNARKDLFQARKDYGDALKEYLTARLKLEAFSGSLGDSHISWVEKYLQGGDPN
jgi:TolC family type I secretion outer membrane protein